MPSSATIAFSNHRPESVPPAKRLMEVHGTIILEEPPDENFEKMLSRTMSIESYLETLDIEYPEFGRAISRTLRNLHDQGKAIFQVEPFMERLLEIHGLFSQGGSPSDIQPGTDLHAVYHSERKATAALLRFYRVSTSGSFEETISAVKKFALMDAERFSLRDNMRAKAVSEIITGQGSYYIEAGQIHYPLWRRLKSLLPRAYPLKVRFLMKDAVREMGYRGHLYGPGDLLTLSYLFHENSDEKTEDLMAARALIYNKLIWKEEITESSVPYPHTLDEFETAETVRKLSLDDCRRLFASIRSVSTLEAREIIRGRP